MRLHRMGVVLLFLSGLATEAPAQMAPNTQRGAVLGGLGGAAAGAIIGDNNDKAGAGAVIGGAIGALAGGALGNARDREIASARAYHWHQQTLAASRAVSVNDVIVLSQSRVSDDVIISSIMNGGIPCPLDVTDIIRMHQSGVSDAVIRSMQRAPIVGARAPAYHPAPVYVERTYAAPATIYRGPTYGYYYAPHYPHGSGGYPRSGWGGSFGAP